MKVCEQCGRNVPRNNSYTDAQWSAIRFCSRQCSGLARRDVPLLQLTPQFIEDRCIPEPNSGCWIWLNGLSSDGYGGIKLTGRSAMTAHRASYIAHHGVVPEGLEVDHLCRLRCCVNPDHLEAVSHRENSRRRSAVRAHCLHGHLLDGISKRGRYCKTCSRQAQARLRSQRSERKELR